MASPTGAPSLAGDNQIVRPVGMTSGSSDFQRTGRHANPAENLPSETRQKDLSDFSNDFAGKRNEMSVRSKHELNVHAH
jgi:hypothetical protein